MVQARSWLNFIAFGILDLLQERGMVTTHSLSPTLETGCFAFFASRCIKQIWWGGPIRVDEQVSVFSYLKPGRVKCFWLRSLEMRHVFRLFFW